ncbi:MAG: tetratricopeptide repeat protein [Thermodesulfobacteriota bacterium]
MWQAIWQWFLVPSNQMLLLAVVLSFALGLVIGPAVKNRRAMPKAGLSLEGDRAFFKGVQYILSNDHDQAIEEFTRAVQLDSGTVETYIALGNLYRSKGDIDRAIRIRRNIILRPSINERQRNRALFDLGLDYRKGGFLDRALKTFTEVLQKEPSNLDALREIEKIYEDLKDWENAFHTRQRIARLVNDDHGHILAHHKTEEGKGWLETGDVARAKACFKKAISLDSGCVDAYLHLGDLYRDRDDIKKAVATWKIIADVAPAFTFLAYRRLEGAYSRLRNPKQVEEFLKECAEKRADSFTHLALGRFLYSSRNDASGAVRELEQALELNPSFWEARTLMGSIFLEQGLKEEALDAYKDLIEHLNVPSLEFQCTQCGYRPADLQWQCPQCRRWDTIARMEPVDVNATPDSPPTALSTVIKGPTEEGE